MQQPLFFTLPEFGCEQIFVVLHKHLPHIRLAQEKRAEFFGKHIAFVHRIPHLARHFIFGIRRGRNGAEIAVGHVFDFVVIVENHAAEAGHAEIFIEHVAGENIGRSQLFERIAVIDHRRRFFGRLGFLHKHIQRLEAVFHIHMLDNHPIVGFFHLAGRERAHFVQKFFVAARFGQSHVLKFQRIGHAPHAVVLFHQQVFLAHIFLIEIFIGAEFVFNHFENIRKRGQGKHAHHQPFHARREHKAVVRIFQMLHKFAPPNVFALLMQAHQCVEIAGRAHWQHAVEKAHIAAGHGHVYQEISARK